MHSAVSRPLDRLEVNSCHEFFPCHLFAEVLPHGLKVLCLEKKRNHGHDGKRNHCFAR